MNTEETRKKARSRLGLFAFFRVSSVSFRGLFLDGVNRERERSRGARQGRRNDAVLAVAQRTVNDPRVEVAGAVVVLADHLALRPFQVQKRVGLGVALDQLNDVDRAGLQRQLVGLEMGFVGGLV